MGRYDRKNDSPYYPTYKANKKTKERLDDTLDVILYCLDKKIKEKRLRDLMSDIFEYLERFKSFHFGISEEVNKMIGSGIKLDSSNVILDHGVPSNVLIKELKSSKPKNQEELIAFFTSNYFMCFITKSEDDQLNKKGLKQKMPPDWDRDLNNWKIRYTKASINLIIEPGV